MKLAFVFFNIARAVRASAPFGWLPACAVQLVAARAEAQLAPLGIDAGVAIVQADASASIDAGAPLASFDAEASGAESVELAAPPAERVAPELATPMVEVTVRGRSRAAELEQSAESVHVIELETAGQQSADLGEVLARTQGVSVRRAGGLGSTQEIALHGLRDEQVRIFIDGVPIAFAGYGAGIANLPVNLLKQVEIYRGVVPIRFGADALGGAINIVTKAPTRGFGGHASLELGSFGTHRATADGHHLHAPTGLLTRARAFVDYAKNDFPVRVTVADEQNQSKRVTVYRPHDAYLSYGGGVDVGFVRRPWAERLILKSFFNQYRKELQNNFPMTRPLGEVEYGGENYGASLQYKQTLKDAISLEAIAGYGYEETFFEDLSEWLYDWYGQRQRRLSPRRGELSNSRRYDQTIWQHALFSRVHAGLLLAPGHTLRLSLAPSHTSRQGEDRTAREGERDPLEAKRSLLVWVTGLEYELRLFDERVENVLFGKSYLYRAEASEPLQGGAVRSRDRSTHRFGVGDGLRVAVLPWLAIKAAYELATRLPSPDEVFGNGALIEANLELKPEYSHNLNLTLQLHALPTAIGEFDLALNGFERRVHDMIVQFLQTALSSYQNVGRVRSRGLEILSGWRSPREYVALGANLTYQDLRNESTRGEYARFEGDRIPHQPYLFANASARGRIPHAFTNGDDLSLTYYLRYVHGFYRAWESGAAGIYEDSKQSVDAQLSHTLSLTYLVRRARRSFSISLDAQNLTDARLYDVFGAQRPGRGYYTKIAADF